MLARIRKSMEKTDSGFTLIELLVVMIIIGILATIAIPTFLNQRKNGYRTAVKSDLRNAASQIESWAVDNGGVYNPTGNVLSTALLTDPTATGWIGFKASNNVTMTVLASTVNNEGYCIQAVHSQINTEPWRYKKAATGGDSEPTKGACS